MQMCSSLAAFDMAIQLLLDRLSLCFPVLHNGMDREQANAYIHTQTTGTEHLVVARVPDDCGRPGCLH